MSKLSIILISFIDVDVVSRFNSLPQARIVKLSVDNTVVINLYVCVVIIYYNYTKHSL